MSFAIGGVGASGSRPGLIVPARVPVATPAPYHVNVNTGADVRQSSVDQADVRRSVMVDQRDQDHLRVLGDG
jgi:hypothetical protein